MTGPLLDVPKPRARVGRQNIVVGDFLIYSRRGYLKPVRTKITTKIKPIGTAAEELRTGEWAFLGDHKLWHLDRIKKQTFDPYGLQSIKTIWPPDPAQGRPPALPISSGGDPLPRSVSPYRYATIALGLLSLSLLLLKACVIR